MKNPFKKHNKEYSKPKLQEKISNKEMLRENQEKQAERRKGLEQLIDSDFDKYDEVFKALA